jgi:hypothetical protein
MTQQQHRGLACTISTSASPGHQQRGSTRTAHRCQHQRPGTPTRSWSFCFLSAASCAVRCRSCVLRCAMRSAWSSATGSSESGTGLPSEPTACSCLSTCITCSRRRSGLLLPVCGSGAGSVLCCGAGAPGASGCWGLSCCLVLVLSLTLAWSVCWEGAGKVLVACWSCCTSRCSCTTCFVSSCSTGHGTARQHARRGMAQHVSTPGAAWHSTTLHQTAT